MLRLALGAAWLATVAAPVFAQSTDEKLDALEARITRLEDLNAIERLQKTYGYFVDKGQWTQLSELFTEDATLEIGGKGLFLGKDRVLEYMHTAFGPDGAKPGVLANHMQFQPIPDISADGETGWIRSRAFVMSNGGWGLPLYENAYRKENGVWKISNLHFYMQAMADYDLGFSRGPLRMEGPSALFPPDKPPTEVYRAFPSGYTPPFSFLHPVTGKPLPVQQPADDVARPK